MTCRACIKLPLYVDGKDSRIDTNMITPPHILLVQLAALENRINKDIGTLNKDRGDIFSECCAESFKAKFLRYVNELLFEIGLKSLK